MGFRCPVLLSLLGLAMAFCQPSTLGLSQTPPSPVPGQSSTSAERPDQPQPPDFRTHYRSHLQLNRGDRTFDVYLYAPDEKTEVLDFSSSFGSRGARQFSGHYELISVLDNDVVSRFDLDPDDSFVENKPHNGLRLVLDPQSGQNLIALFQYGNSNSESVQFFSLDPSGSIFLINFLDRDGRTWKQMLTGPEGAIRQTAEGAHVFCSYANTLRYFFCGSYSFDGENLQEVAEWMTQDTAALAKVPTDLDLAARALYEYLSALSAHEYSAAAFYLGPVTHAAAGPLSTNSRNQSTAFLEDYCTVRGGQCFTPVKLAPRPVADSPGVLRFVVSFQNPEFQPLKIGSASSFDFRVAKTASGFKVLDLPPRVPEKNSRQ